MDDANKTGCIYCGLPFGAVVEYDGANIELRRTIEHLVPWAYVPNDAAENLALVQFASETNSSTVHRWSEMSASIAGEHRMV